MATMTRIEQSSLEQLRELAKSHRRSMTQELAVLIDAASPKSSDQTAAKEAIDTMMLKGIPEAWNPAKFTPRKPRPKGKQ